MEMAARLENQEVQEKIKELLQVMESDPVTAKIMDEAETAEDMYEAAKRYSDISFEDFKQYFDEAVNLYENKSEVSDEVMECVAGGGFWDSLWKGIKKVACATACIAGIDLPRKWME